MTVGMIARLASSSGSRLFQSYRSYSVDPRLWSANGFVQLSIRWKIGHRRNMPPGEGSCEMTAWSMPSRRRLYVSCSAPGPLPTTTSE